MASELKGNVSRESKIIKSALSITFSGPMLFDFVTDDKAGLVDIYVPFCPYHEAGFYFSSSSLSEIDVWKNEKNAAARRPLNIAYKITSDGIRPNPKADLISSNFPKGPKPITKTPPESELQQGADRGGVSDSVYILQLGGQDGAAKKTKCTPPTYKTMFRLTVPMPRYVAPLYCDNVEVLDSFGGKASHTLYQHCTALRFFYEWNAGSAIWLGTPANSYDITPSIFSHLPQMADIEVRYEGIDIEDENDPHSDARSCFANLATLAGVEWWINYQDGLTTPSNPSRPPDLAAAKAEKPRSVSAQRVVGHNLVSHTGGDCHAPIIVNNLA